MGDLQAKPTFYNGYLFRSKLEAKWAVFFSLLGVPYEYESDAFECADGSQYTPDFYLPKSYLRYRDTQGVFLEIKPANWEYDGPYAERIATALEDRSLVIFCGDPLDLFNSDQENNYQLSPGWDNYMTYMYCEKCRVLKVDFSFCNHHSCPLCEGRINSPETQRLASEARAHRFPYHKITKR